MGVLAQRARTEARRLAAAFVGMATSVFASDHPMVGTKLIIVDKMAQAAVAKAVFLAKDGIVEVGAGTDASDIEAMLEIAYDNVSGSFVMPSGSGWRLESGPAKYANPSAPVGGTVKTSVIKPGNLVKVVAKSLGDTPLDISLPPSGLVYVAHTVVNGGSERRHCTQFAGCSHRPIAAGTGSKLVCKGISASDGACVASTPACITNRFVDQGLTVLDTCTNLEWEKKQGVIDSIAYPAFLHEVDNAYSWAGRCSTAPSKLCQPNAAAEAACKAGTPPVSWTAGGCEQCAPGEGTCSAPFAITTIWDWIRQVNDENFAGHNDWRVPTSAGDVPLPTDEPPELESIVAPGFLDLSCGLTGPACIDPVFGPTHPSWYWSVSSFDPPLEPTSGIAVDFFQDNVRHPSKYDAVVVRAVR